MENFDSKRYRDNLAKDLKEIRKADPEKAHEILTKAQETEQYQEAKRIHQESLENKKRNQEIAKSFVYYNYYPDEKDFFSPESLKEFDLSGLENCAVIAIERNDGTHSLEVGTDIALSLLNKDSMRPILLYGFHSIDGFKKVVPKSELLFAKENVRYLQLPYNAEDLVKALSKQSSTEINTEKIQELQQAEVSKKVSQWLHIIDRFPEKVMNEVKEFFPTLNDKTDKEIEDFLFKIRQNVPEVMKGQNIEGVYCDIEGTLFNGEELNQNTLNKLKELESQGKNITLWTDGDINQLQKLIEENGITYPLKSKIDHAGASAEIVIDNDDENTFSAKTKIFAKKFIKV